MGSERPYQPHKLIVPVLFTQRTNIEEMDRLAKPILENTTNILERVGVYEARMAAFQAQNKMAA